MSKSFEAEKFVHFLLNEGAKHACDESSDAFTQCANIPDFFDKQKFERGQEFYQRNKLGMTIGMYFSLVVGLAIPWFRKILMLTNMSSTPKAAYKRYVQTNHYIDLWYTEKFDPNSSFLPSLSAIRKFHNNASNKACKNHLPRITQRDMALTQLGFFGFLLLNPERFGIHHATYEDKEAVLHVWRVIGFMLGVEDRFNVCKRSVQETREIVSTVFLHVVVPNINEREDDFVQLAEALVRGLKITPFVDLDVMLTYAVLSFTNLEHICTAFLDRLCFMQKLKLMLFTHFINLSKHPPFNVIYYCILKVSMWIQTYFVRPHFTPSRKMTKSYKITTACGGLDFQ